MTDLNVTGPPQLGLRWGQVTEERDDGGFNAGGDRSQVVVRRPDRARRTLPANATRDPRRSRPTTLPERDDRWTIDGPEQMGPGLLTSRRSPTAEPGPYRYARISP